MSHKLPSVRGKQRLKVLEAEGWYLKRTKGSHHIMRHPTIPDAISVPIHGNRNIKPGLLLNILKTAGISRAEFQRLL
ncbi:MAG: type II toxin-antitoxin system HicA family toxin [Solirubrobacterales bacterium]